MIDGVTKVIEYEEKLAGGMAPDAVRGELQTAGLIPTDQDTGPAPGPGHAAESQSEIVSTDKDKVQNPMN